MSHALSYLPSGDRRGAVGTAELGTGAFVRVACSCRIRPAMHDVAEHKLLSQLTSVMSEGSADR